MWEIDRMLLRGDIDVEDHATLEQFMHDIHNLRLFSLPPQTLEVKSHTNIPSTGTMREAVAWKKLTKIRERFKQISLELDTAMMDLGLDVPKSYEPSLIKVGVQKLTEFYQEW
jgi:hypothetical protein